MSRRCVGWPSLRRRARPAAPRSSRRPSAGYEPAKLDEVEGSDVKRVTLHGGGRRDRAACGRRPCGGSGDRRSSRTPR